MTLAALWQPVAVGVAMDGERITTTEAAGKLAWALAHGESLTNRQAACMTGLPYETTRQMLERLSRVLPVTFYRGCWYVVSLNETR